MNVFRMGWRNIWRNRRRTFITAAAIGLGVTSLVFSSAVANGIFDRIVKVATESLTGDAQIHADGYRATLDEKQFIPDADKVLERVRAVPGVQAASPRVITSGLLSIGSRSRNVKVIGVDIEHEPNVTNWPYRLVSGKYPHDPVEAMIGLELAQKLEIETGAKIVLTVANVETGEAMAEALRIVGVLSTGDASIDKGTAIISSVRLQRMMGIGKGVHEVVMALDVSTTDRKAIEKVIAPAKAEGLDVQPWHEINKMVAGGLQLQSAYLNSFLFIIFFIIAFGIVNTLSMSLAERMKEFGVLRAIGTSPMRLGGMILSEAGWIALVGALPGAVIGLAVTAYFGSSGINLAGTSTYGVNFNDALHPQVDIAEAVYISVVFIVLTVLVAGFTAWKAARVRPVDAMRG